MQRLAEQRESGARPRFGLRQDFVVEKSRFFTRAACEERLPCKRRDIPKRLNVIVVGTSRTQRFAKMFRVDKISYPNLSSLSVSKRRDETSAPISAPTTSDPTTSPAPLTASATTNPDPDAVIRKIANFKPPAYSYNDNDLFRSKQSELERLRSDVLMMDGRIDIERIQDATNMHLARTRKKLENVRRMLISFPRRMDSEGGGSGNADKARANLISEKQAELRALFEELVLALTLVVLAEERKDAEKNAVAAASGGSKSKEEMDVEEAIAKIKAVERRTDLQFENELQNEIFKIVGDTLNSVSEAASPSNNRAEATRMKIATVESGIKSLNKIEIVTYSSLSRGAMEARSLAATKRTFVDFMTELVVMLNLLVGVYASADPGSRIVRQRTQ